MSNDLDGLLQTGLEALSLDLPLMFRIRCIEFCALIERWNQHVNLTAVREPAAMITRHILDSVAILPYIKGKRCMDVGTGAGLPGIPLALAHPNQDWFLLEKTHKKACFLLQAITELALNNVQIVQKRVEYYDCEEGFDTIVSRAVADVPTLLKLCGHLCRPTGQMVLMTGRYQPDITVDPAWIVDQQPLAVPGLDEPRHVVCLTRK